MTVGIYGIFNQVNGKMYIGSSKNIEIRIWNHFSELRHNKHCNTYLQRAWNKYGEECFVTEILEECPEEILLNREQWWVTNTPRLYNIAMDVRRSSITLETKQKISKSLLGNRCAEGHKPSEEVRSRWSEIRKGKPIKPFSEDHRKRLSEAHLGKKLSDEHRQRLSESHKGIFLSEETKQRLREISLDWWARKRAEKQEAENETS